MTRRYKFLLTWLAAPLFVVGALTIDSATVSAQRRGGPGQATDAGPFGPLRWRNVGPERGGRSLAVAGSTARPNRVLLSALPAGDSGRPPMAA